LYLFYEPNVALHGANMLCREENEGTIRNHGVCLPAIPWHLWQYLTTLHLEVWSDIQLFDRLYLSLLWLSVCGFCFDMTCIGFTGTFLDVRESEVELMICTFWQFFFQSVGYFICKWL